MPDKLKKKKDTVPVDGPLKNAKVVPVKVKTKADAEKEKKRAKK
jgi:copper(I)-binding protein